MVGVIGLPDSWHSWLTSERPRLAARTLPLSLARSKRADTARVAAPRAGTKTAEHRCGGARRCAATPHKLRLDVRVLR